MYHSKLDEGKNHVHYENFEDVKGDWLAQRWSYSIQVWEREATVRVRGEKSKPIANCSAPHARLPSKLASAARGRKTKRNSLRKGKERKGFPVICIVHCKQPYYSCWDKMTIYPSFWERKGLKDPPKLDTFLFLCLMKYGQQGRDIAEPQYNMHGLSLANCDQFWTSMGI